MSASRHPGIAQGGAELRGPFRVQSPIQETPDLGWVRIKPFGQGLGRIADPRELRVEAVESGRQGVLDDLSGDGLGSEVECVGQRPVQVLGELKRRGQPLDKEVLGLGCGDAVRIDAVLKTGLEQPPHELPALVSEGHEVELRRAIPDLFHRGAPQVVLQARMPHEHHRELASAGGDELHQPLETIEGVAMERKDQMVEAALADIVGEDEAQRLVELSEYLDEYGLLPRDPPVGEL